MSMRTSSTLRRRPFCQRIYDEGHRQAFGVSTIWLRKGPENLTNPFYVTVPRRWRRLASGDGHPCYGCNEEGIGFHKGIHQLAHVENQTPRSEKPDVNMKEGGNILRARRSACGV